MSHTKRWLLPLPRTERFIVAGSISRGSRPAPAGALATPISASVCATTSTRSGAGTYTAYGDASSNTLVRSPMSRQACSAVRTVTRPRSTTTHVSAPGTCTDRRSPAVRR